ncbi:MAG: class I SAM-dependent methyltransferase [Nitrospiraceae bacterium]
MKWQLKLLKNSIIGVLPIPVQERARTIKRRISPHQLEIDVRTLKQGLQQVRMLKTSGCDPSSKDYLELGTGWSPIIPVVFYLAGCKSLTLVDRQRLMDDHTFQATCRQLIGHSQEISEKLKIQKETVENKLVILSNLPLKSALREINCNYLAPYDLLETNIPDQSIDVVTSRAVLEHIPPRIVRSLFGEFNRLLRKDGAMCHIIDNSDHWEHNDKSIPRLNFLKYSQTTFGLMSAMNPLDYQNRLRHSEYKKMIEDAGFRVVYDESSPDEKAMTDLKSIRINPFFNQFSEDDLAILTSCIVVRKQFS